MTTSATGSIQLWRRNGRWRTTSASLHVVNGVSAFQQTWIPRYEGHSLLRRDGGGSVTTSTRMLSSSSSATRFPVRNGVAFVFFQTPRPNHKANQHRPQVRRFVESSSSSSSSSTESTTETSTESVVTAATSLRSDNVDHGNQQPETHLTLRRIKTVHATSAIENHSNELIKVQGWVRTIRQQKTVAFIQVNDGSNLEGIQGVATLDDLNESSKIALDSITTGAAVEIHGFLVQSKGQNQAVEVQVSNIVLVGACPADTYPLAKKRHTLEYLRTIAHLRARTNTHSAVSRVRSQLALAIHEYYQNVCGFVYVHTPLITASDCEGAGELFRVTTFDTDFPQSIPQRSTNSSSSSSTNTTTLAKTMTTTTTPTSGTDYSKDFFNKPAYLTVSGQLNAEAYATALGDVYTFGPTFRAENSQTARHLAEFHMIEPEMSFCDINGAMDNAEGMLKFVTGKVLKTCIEDIQFFTKFFDNQLITKLERLRDESFVRISYKDAIQYLQEEIQKDRTKWQFPDVEFGTDLATEHERWLAETKFNSCVFVYNYPKAIKSFYMRDNNDDNNDSTPSKMTVAAMDLLVPGVGELIGGSQREERLDRLIAKITDAGLNVEDYSWYLDLRRYGSVPHSGYGLGFERLVTYVCGLENIRDAIAFPRYPGNAEF